jgi:hypothetical protein
VGILIVCFGAWVIASTLHANVLWFLLGLPMVLLGSLLIAIAASARSAHWVYVNIQEAGKHRHNIRFGVPFPIGFVRGALWIAKCVRWNPKINVAFNKRESRANMDWAEIDEILVALEHELEAQRGISVDVDDNGERVQVYIV